MGGKFFAEFIRNAHSGQLHRRTPHSAVIIRTGGTKFDHTPVDGGFFDLRRLAKHGEKKGVLCLVATRRTPYGSTRTVGTLVYPSLDQVFSRSTWADTGDDLCFFGA